MTLCISMYLDASYLKKGKKLSLNISVDEDLHKTSTKTWSQPSYYSYRHKLVRKHRKRLQIFSKVVSSKNYKNDILILSSSPRHDNLNEERLQGKEIFQKYYMCKTILPMSITTILILNNIAPTIMVSI